MAQRPGPIVTVDCDYVAQRFAAAYLIAEPGAAAFVDNNTRHAVPALLAALDQAVLSRDEVLYLIVTHIHLDHASGTAELLRHLPNATVLAHPRAAPHLIDPSRLVSSARKVYGDARFLELYGEIEPIDPKRVRSVDDGERLQLGTRQLTFLHTRGHANHHFVIHDEGSQSVFSGDAFGLRYPDLQRDQLFILPSTSPTDFDPDEAIRSIDRIVATGARSVYPTHFGRVDEVHEAATELKRQIQWSGELLVRAVASSLPDAGLDEFCRQEIDGFYSQYAPERGVTWDAATRRVLEMDLDLNAQGVAHVARKKRVAAKMPTAPDRG